MSVTILAAYSLLRTSFPDGTSKPSSLCVLEERKGVHTVVSLFGSNFQDACQKRGETDGIEQSVNDVSIATLLLCCFACT